METEQQGFINSSPKEHCFIISSHRERMCRVDMMGLISTGTVASANQLQTPLSKANQDKNPPRTIVAIFGADQKSEGLGMGR